jgi:hypothetical protein
MTAPERFPRIILRRQAAVGRTENPRVGGSIPPLATTQNGVSPRAQRGPECISCFTAIYHMADMTAVPFHGVTTRVSRACSSTSLHRGSCSRAQDLPWKLVSISTKSYSTNWLGPPEPITSRGTPLSVGRSQLGSLKLAATQHFVSSSMLGPTQSREEKIDQRLRSPSIPQQFLATFHRAGRRGGEVTRESPGEDDAGAGRVNIYRIDAQC